MEEVRTKPLDKEEFCKLLKAFCLENGFQIAGTCEGEGIYGEITVKKMGENSNGWMDWDKRCFNFHW